MTNHAVTLRVTPCLRVECKFWLGDDGWNGSTEYPSITVTQPASSRRSRTWNSHWRNTPSRF
jgi:hypothetical protein